MPLIGGNFDPLLLTLLPFLEFVLLYFGSMILYRRKRKLWPSVPKSMLSVRQVQGFTEDRRHLGFSTFDCLSELKENNKEKLE
jgi:hypothetical protein